MEGYGVSKIGEHALTGDDSELERVHDSWVEHACVTGLAENGDTLEHSRDFDQKEMGDENARVVECSVLGLI